jgi:flagellar biogenesis protein FliO
MSTMIAILSIILVAFYGFAVRVIQNVPSERHTTSLQVNSEVDIGEAYGCRLVIDTSLEL